MEKEEVMSQPAGQEEKKEEGQKLTYEQLTSYAQQLSNQAKKVWEENQMLKKTINEINLGNSFKEIELVLKCLDHADMFSPSFIDAVVRRLEEVLMPQEQKESEEETKED